VNGHVAFRSAKKRFRGVIGSNQLTMSRIPVRPNDDEELITRPLVTNLHGILAVCTSKK